MRFIVVAHRLHLLIEPGWFFTVDGVEPVEGRQIGVLSVKWGGREGNATVLRHTLMWARLLAAGQPAITLPGGGNNVIKVAPVPTFGRANVGIFQDSSGLERLLAGEGAGEIPGADAGEDLDRIAEAHLRGAIELEDDSEEDGEDSNAISDIENAIEQTEAEPEFPW